MTPSAQSFAAVVLERTLEREKHHDYLQAFYNAAGDRLPLETVADLQGEADRRVRAPVFEEWRVERARILERMDVVKAQLRDVAAGLPRFTRGPHYERLVARRLELGSALLVLQEEMRLKREALFGPRRARPFRQRKASA